ncbi:hypothetical protein C8J56DRAFT_834838 [Mycena floridula]|nr:hypothetical protein C8J56DRAFT_834838 [Mycena floridula]
MSKSFSAFPQSFSIPLTEKLAGDATKSASSSSKPIAQSTITSASMWQAPAHWATTPAPASSSFKRKSTKLSKRTAEERDISAKTAARVTARLAADHSAVLSPDTETPFSDLEDVVNRLLPYHVFQQPKDDLENIGKGKAKATEAQLEIHDTKFALQCFKRRQALEDRFRRTRIKSGKKPIPIDQAYALASIVVESERHDNALLTAELKAARAERDRLDSEKRAAVNPYRTPYYTAPAPAVTSTQPYYRPYHQYSYHQPAAAATAAPEPVSSYVPQTTGPAIPVQLPVSSLPALHALGIEPVPPSLAEGRAHAAVLRGSSADGTMLSLEINVSLLGSHQMNGLSGLLTSLIGPRANSTPTTVLGAGSI